jgi:hypothetical protein
VNSALYITLGILCIITAGLTTLAGRCSWERLSFVISASLYLACFGFVAWDLSVPPDDLPFFLSMIVFAACALVRSPPLPRWRRLCIGGIAIAVLGTLCEIVSPILRLH